MCSSGLARHISRRGHFVSGKVSSLYRRDLFVMPCLYFRRLNINGKSPRHIYCCPDAPDASRVSGGAACWPWLTTPFSGGLGQGVGNPACPETCSWIRWVLPLLLCLPVCRLPESSCSEATMDTRACILSMVALSSFG